VGVLPSGPSELGPRGPGVLVVLAERVVTLGALGSGNREDGFLTEPGAAVASVAFSALALYSASLTSLGTALILDGFAVIRRGRSCQRWGRLALPRLDLTRLHGPSPFQPGTSVPYG